MKTTDEIIGLVQLYGAARHDAGFAQAIKGHCPRVRELEIDAGKSLREIRAALTASLDWQGIDSHPTTEHEPFLILRPGNSVCSSLVQQVSMFQGDMYPDELDANIDYTDRITDAKGWKPLPPPPAEGEK